MDPKKSKDRPFYELPENVPTSTQIINEARTSLRTITTNRPFTPRDERRMFPSTTARPPESRPASAFSLNSRHFEGGDSRPVSGTRLSPLDHFPDASELRVRTDLKAPRTPSAAEIESAILSPKPPADPNRSLSRKGSRQKLSTATSLEGGGEATHASRPRSGSSDAGRSMHGSEPTTPDQDCGQRVHSGPRDRTQPMLPEERGTADGKEAGPRVSSSMGVCSPPRSTGSADGERVSSGGSRKSNSAGKTRTDSAGKREAADAASDVFYSEKVAPLIDELVAVGKTGDVDRLCALADEVYVVLDDGNKLSKSYKQRTTILRAIFKLLDIEDCRVKLKLARLLLAFKVGGNNLLNVCKLVFKVARNEKNDHVFMEGNILDLLINTLKITDHVTCCEAMVYCVGALKFITGNTMIQERLVEKDCIEMLTTLMLDIEKTSRDSKKSNDQFANILVQIVAALRNLAEVSSWRERFIKCRVVESLNTMLASYPNDSDLVLYISRIFSKLTLYTDCCRTLANQHSSYKSFIQLLNRNINGPAVVVVRICFVLGNLTAKNDDARLRLFHEPNAFPTLLSVLRAFLKMDSQTRPKSESISSYNQDRDQSGAIDIVDDVLIKVIRVIANLSINDTVGPMIAADTDCLLLLLAVLDHKDMTKSEDLILNTVATINNLSYYTAKTSAVTSHQDRVAAALLKLMTIDNMEATLETSRVFGNLTRHKSVRDLLSENKVDEIMITLLDSGNRELVFIACGVLVNFMADDDKRPLLKQEGGIRKLVEVLRDLGREDWQLSSIVCKVLCNYSTKITSTSSCFGEVEARDLCDVLLEYLDPDFALEPGTNDDLKSVISETWEEDFCPVASQLIKRIESHQSQFEPL